MWEPPSTSTLSKIVFVLVIATIWHMVSYSAQQSGRRKEAAQLHIAMDRYRATCIDGRHKPVYDASYCVSHDELGQPLDTGSKTASVGQTSSPSLPPGFAKWEKATGK